ncbi:MAG TPA: SAM-dependent methyltransferase [Pyrinomonadaceae bacterium]|nr:SAM-dependent methyltransferase [Pyrinomonadaceae bacterium]
MSASSKVRNSDPLSDRLRARIKQQGPIPFHKWMAAALYDERDGYYCRADRIPQGRAGDYRTAPETSPLFAATFASYFSKLFVDLKWPPSLTIFEAGAGSGEFAHGVLTSLRRDSPEVFAVTSYVIDEISRDARLRAAERLAEFSDRISFRRLIDIDTPVVAGIIFSNEVIDALPVHRVIKRDGTLRELFVGVNESDFVWVEGDLDTSVTEYCTRAGIKLSEGQIAEINLEAERFVARSAGLLDRGYVVTVDYGAERNDLLGDPNRHRGTLRAFRRHRFVDDVLTRPGEQDLTTTVDWTQIIEAGDRAGLRTLRLERLDQFLLGQGLTSVLTEMMTSTHDSVEALQLTTSSRELILPTGMAASFQVLVQEKRG